MSGAGPLKTLLFSCRRQNANLAASCFYEFEDLIRDWMSADLIAPEDLPYNIRRKAQTALYRLTKSAALSRPLATPRLGPKRLEAHYDLIFAVLPNIGTTYKLIDFQNLRQSCGILAAYVPEVWVRGMRENIYQMEPLKSCDHIFVSTHHSAETVTKLTGKPCTFLRFGVDAMKFSPHPVFPERFIDVLNIGRRAPVTHAALLEAARGKDFHYVYDTVNSIKAIEPAEHRLYYANTAMRTKYYIANTANFDQDWKTGGALEIGHRYYEGLAAGAVIVGATPADHPVIRSDFDWQDAFIQAPFEAPQIVEQIGELEADRARVETIRTENIAQCALRHDFVYRWAQVLSELGLEETALMQERRAALQAMAGQVRAGTSGPRIKAV